MNDFYIIQDISSPTVKINEMVSFTVEYTPRTPSYECNSFEGNNLLLLPHNFPKYKRTNGDPIYTSISLDGNKSLIVKIKYSVFQRKLFCGCWNLTTKLNLAERYRFGIVRPSGITTRKSFQNVVITRIE